MITKEELDQIIERYNKGLPTGYTDEEYDLLLEEYVKAHGEASRPYTRQKQSSAVNDVVGTLPKTYGVTSAMRDNQKTYQQWIESKGLTSQQICLQPKFDGCSVAVDLQTGRFFTRGDYDNGESVDVTELFEHVQWIQDLRKNPTNTTAVLKFEAILSQERFRELQLHLKYKRPRDVVAATITSRNVELAKYITLVPLRGYVSRREGHSLYYIPDTLKDISLICDCQDYHAIEQFIKQKLNDNATVSLYDQTFAIDGVVVSILNDERHASLCYVNTDYEVAIKILYNVQTTKLKTIEYQFGKQGRITPVAILQPVMFDNVTVDHVTLSTLERVVEMGLKHNDTVRVMYNIVPYLIDSANDGDYRIPIPDKCPICHAPLDVLSLKQVRCSNPNCKGLKLGSIIRYAEKMKMMGVSKGIITKLYDEGIVTSISDLLRLTPDQFQSLDGFGTVSANNIVNSIREQSTNVSMTKFLGALPINDTSEETWKYIEKAFGPSFPTVIQSMLNGSLPELIMSCQYIPNVGTTKLQKIVDGYIRNKDDIIETIKLVTFQQQKTNTTKGRVCLTGTRDTTTIKLLEDHGYEVGGFSKDCVAVIVPDTSFNSAKTEKARQLNIPIYTLAEVPGFIGGA